ncbi:MAG: hypothetical protein RL219_1283 [Actinomycetota bacterium]|jgi:hypothetical protein
MLRNRQLVTLLCSALVLVSCGGGSSSSEALETAVTFRDPQGFYVIDIDPSWERRTDVPSPSVEVWSMGEAVDEFQPNVNILRDAPGGRDLVQYMEFSADNLGSLSLVGKAVVKGKFGNELGVFEYTGRVPQADRSLHFLAIVMVTPEHAIVATLSVVESAFDDIRKQVEPFMRTLRPPQVS